MNKKRRMKNRETARQLSRDTAPPCPECGQKGPHWVGVPMTLADLMSGTEPEGFWLCDKFYGPDGKRLPANAELSGLTRPYRGRSARTTGWPAPQRTQT